MSAGLSMATMIRAARTIFSLSRLLASVSLEYVPVPFSFHICLRHAGFPRAFTSIGACYVPGLANVDNVDAIGTGLPEVRLVVNLEAVLFVLASLS